MSKETIKELRFKVIKKMLDDFPELKERLKEHLEKEKDKTS
ncbi:MAG: hypothetical protein NWF06_09655 [Candidatus Bathyarchaeota archaeon]|nr:hypothetical protein [Candidatus Bathyarchaeum sp.]